MKRTSPLVDAMIRAVDRAVEQRAPAWMLATVTAVYGDGTVDITTARGPVESVRRLLSYSSPTVGDVVKVDRNADGNWIVVGKLAS
ncbi:hypothetical protein [Streptomyces sp. DH12]|uniref:hypothetical protein n=1 Tax=Streptomyces sp. DH12 TaxID=2857010 RepID=UPI001E2CCCB6|nr:hypothetical protein [Streptomyces sp. DH12]